MRRDPTGPTGTGCRYRVRGLGALLWPAAVGCRQQGPGDRGPSSMRHRGATLKAGVTAIGRSGHQWLASGQVAAASGEGCSVVGEDELVALDGWSGVVLGAPLVGGHRNSVFRARRGDRELVVRRSTRPAAALEWELDLLAHLAACGVGVPGTVPADDGRRHVNGLMVQEFMRGRAPTADYEWRLVADALRRVHELTEGWPQRPGFASASQLLTARAGGDIDFDTMLASDVENVRTAWRPLLGGVECAIHGDAGGGNILIDGQRVTLLDWDEARVDVPSFDFAFVPAATESDPRADRDALVTAGVAWEAATCWVAEPDYARHRLDELLDRMGRHRHV